MKRRSGKYNISLFVQNWYIVVLKLQAVDFKREKKPQKLKLLKIHMYFS